VSALNAEFPPEVDTLAVPPATPVN